MIVLIWTGLLIDQHQLFDLRFFVSFRISCSMVSIEHWLFTNHVHFISSNDKMITWLIVFSMDTNAMTNGTEFSMVISNNFHLDSGVIVAYFNGEISIIGNFTHKIRFQYIYQIEMVVTLIDAIHLMIVCRKWYHRQTTLPEHPIV